MKTPLVVISLLLFSAVVSAPVSAADWDRSTSDSMLRLLKVTFEVEAGVLEADAVAAYSKSPWVSERIRSGKDGYDIVVFRLDLSNYNRLKNEAAKKRTAAREIGVELETRERSRTAEKVEKTEKAEKEKLEKAFRLRVVLEADLEDAAIVFGGKQIYPGKGTQRPFQWNVEEAGQPNVKYVVQAEILRRNERLLSKEKTVELRQGAAPTVVTFTKKDFE